MPPIYNAIALPQDFLVDPAKFKIVSNSTRPCSPERIKGGPREVP
jgi:hypothetical protein